ncbi:Pfam:DUF567 [Seminavis robusta]|uniref:Pfam:DUF567 n=1 Tax=Seminavis robusta TaxID=568900 RepID=A0A9N8H4M6_9STRA|nr:Pfam:DUF567 [Seminavis robusta]|eukprot:Sro119_g057950.1 Pfam:DUF567 (196) ;mRNA; f:20104-20691
MGIRDRMQARQERRQERREEEEEDDGPKVYAMREKLLLGLGDDFNINKMHRRRGMGETAFIANNKVLRLRETFNLQTSDHETLYQIQERKLRARDAMAIEDADGNKVAEIKKKVLGLLRDNFVVKVRDDTDWAIKGSILEHDFTIEEDGNEIVKVHKNWIAPVRDCYYIEISEGVDEGLALCVCIALESMTSGDD